jgi:hypothetical protein
MLPWLRWNEANLGVLAPVMSIGYAYGSLSVDSEVMILARAFSGHIVCTIPRYRPVGFEGRSFSVHEVSFAAPRGLSGAPLLSNGDHTQVRDLIIGNSRSEMLVHSATEQVSDWLRIERVERFEGLYLGIAVRACEIMGLKSNLLGATIGEHLQATHLTVNADA